MKKPEIHNSPTLLIILDGFGLAPAGPGNAIDAQSAPNIFGYMEDYPSTELAAHGAAVGLFENQSGNSESGHFTIGSGRIIKQDLVHISEAIDDGTFFKNTAFEQALFHAKKYETKVHIFGLLTGNESPHARPDHLYALLEYFRREEYSQIYLHLFTDGRDSPPHSAVQYLKALQAELLPNEQIATIMGRHYAMDRNKNWKRTQLAYETISNGSGTHTAASAEEAIAAAYNRGETDEYVAPTVIVDEQSTPVATVSDNDAMYFFNARSDRARQLTKAFVQDDFVAKNPGAFERTSMPDNTRFVAMTDFGPDLPCILTAFPSPDIEHCLANAIGTARKQLFISETEKYAHVTFFLNGGYPQPIDGEVRELIPSADVFSFADKPEMHTKEVTKKVVSYIKKQTYNFICVNLPNADMVGHTGNIEATRQAVGVLDKAVREMVDAALAAGGTVMITADHGNAECMLSGDGQMMTAHTNSPVPFFVVSKALKGQKLRSGGGLQDVVPTLLRLMEIPVPEDMTGTTLL